MTLEMLEILGVLNDIGSEVAESRPGMDLRAQPTKNILLEQQAVNHWIVPFTETIKTLRNL